VSLLVYVYVYACILLRSDENSPLNVLGKRTFENLSRSVGAVSELVLVLVQTFVCKVWVAPFCLPCCFLVFL